MLPSLLKWTNSNIYLFMINVIKLKSKTFFICFIVLVAFSSCNVSSSSTEDIELTPEKAIGKLADLSAQLHKSVAI